MILPGTSKEDALLVCRNIQHSIAEDRNFSEDNCHPTMSIGICEWSEEITADEMIKAADDAMYLSKDEGKDRIKIC
jgi:diguanylate cyclase (GGDEF)-like protein